MPEAKNLDELRQFASDLQLMRDRAINLHLDAIEKNFDWMIRMVYFQIARVDGSSCPYCKSGATEIYERSREGEGWICRACNHTWLAGGSRTPSEEKPISTVRVRSTSPCSEYTSCPRCGSKEFEYRTYGGSWEDADTHCAKCGKLIHRAWAM
jgi:ribosomal protein L37AE/L43A